ncbi:MAG: FAD-dependent oxidoreductase, partial [Thermoleophilia bacterium]
VQPTRPTVNVAVGQEATLSEDLITPSQAPRRVLVVGGGPAGLEAARVAALRGHRVVLAEASADLGGAVNLAARAPRRLGIADIVRWQEREVRRLGVEVRLGTWVERADVEEIAPDVVIVATGSSPRLDGRQYLAPGVVASGMDQRHVLSSHDVLTNRGRPLGTHALVYDDVGHYEAIAVAESLLERGLFVTFVTGQASFSPKLEPSLSAAPALERFGSAQFQLHTYARLIEVGAQETRIAFHYGGERMVRADIVVFVSHNACNRELLDALGDWPGTVLAAGDVVSPRFLQTAIREGHLAGRGII